MNNPEMPNGNESNETDEELLPAFTTPPPPSGPCNGHPHGCATAAYVIAQRPSQEKPRHGFSQDAQAILEGHGTFAVLIVILDTFATEPFPLIVRYTLNGADVAPRDDRKEPFVVVSGYADGPLSSFRIPVEKGSATGQTAFRVAQGVPARELLITVSHGDGTILLQQTLSALERNLESAAPEHKQAFSGDADNGGKVVIAQRITVPL